MNKACTKLCGESKMICELFSKKVTGLRESHKMTKNKRAASNMSPIKS